MMQDADFAGNFISVEEIGKIFVMVNFETDKASKRNNGRNVLHTYIPRPDVSDLTDVVGAFG